MKGVHKVMPKKPTIIKPTARSNKKWSWDQIQTMRQMYYEQGKTVREIRAAFDDQ